MEDRVLTLCENEQVGSVNSGFAQSNIVGLGSILSFDASARWDSTPGHPTAISALCTSDFTIGAGGGGGIWIWLFLLGGPSSSQRVIASTWGIRDTIGKKDNVTTFFVGSNFLVHGYLQLGIAVNSTGTENGRLTAWLSPHRGWWRAYPESDN